MNIWKLNWKLKNETELNIEKWNWIEYWKMKLNWILKIKFNWILKNEIEENIEIGLS